MNLPVFAGWNTEIHTDSMTDEQVKFVLSDKLDVAIFCLKDYVEFDLSNFEKTRLLDNYINVIFLLPDRVRSSNSEVIIRYRFDKDSSERISFDKNEGGDKLSLLVGKNPSLQPDLHNKQRDFIKKLLSKKRLLMRIPTYDNYTDIEINLNGLTEELVPLLEFCEWN